MKRLLMVCLALCCLLTACAAPSEEAPATEAPSTEAPTTEPPQTTEPQMQDEPATLHVATDESGYSPRTAVEAKYTRLREEPITELEPGSYGMIYPFAADWIYSKGSEGYSYAAGNYYGFVTEDGMIVCDPTYVRAYQLTVYEYDEYGSAQTALPLWVLGRMGEVEIVTNEEYSWATGSMQYAVAALDGSFVTDCCYRSVSGFAGGFVGYRDAAYDVYDLQGKLKFRYEDLPYALRSGDYPWLSATGNCFIADDSEGRACLIDENGKQLCGPFAQLGDLKEGLLYASEDGEHYGYVTPEGDWQIEPVYTEVRAFHNGYASVKKENGLSVLIDHDGNAVLTLQCDYFKPIGDDYCMAVRYNEGNSVYRLDGTKVLRGGYGLNWEYLDEDVCYAARENDILVHWLDSGRETTVSPASYFYYGCKLGEYAYGGQPCYCAVNSSSEGYESILLSADMEELLRTEGYVNQLYDGVLGAYYTMISDENYRAWRCYRPDGSLALRCGYDDEVLAANGMLLVTNQRACTMYDADGEVVFCYPLLALLDD